jgi:hypothetical protein
VHVHLDAIQQVLCHVWRMPRPPQAAQGLIQTAHKGRVLMTCLVHLSLSPSPRRPSVALADVLVMLQACDMSKCPTHHAQAPSLCIPLQVMCAVLVRDELHRRLPRREGFVMISCGCQEGSRRMQRVLKQQDNPRTSHIRAGLYSSVHAMSQASSMSTRSI